MSCGQMEMLIQHSCRCVIYMHTSTVTVQLTASYAAMCSLNPLTEGTSGKLNEHLIGLYRLPGLNQNFGDDAIS